MPFSVAVAQSVTAAAAASGVELLMLDNRYDPDIAIQNAEEFVAKRVDLVLEFQVEEAWRRAWPTSSRRPIFPWSPSMCPTPTQPTLAWITSRWALKPAPCWPSTPCASGRASGLGARRGIRRGRQLCQNRITGAFDGIRDRLKDLPADRFIADRRPRHARAQPMAVAEFLRDHRKGEHILVAAATDSSALGVLDAAREAGREGGLRHRRPGLHPRSARRDAHRQSAIIGSISHEVETYGPRLIQLGIALLRGYTVPPYNYVRHKT
jgi:ribose transport system substrate-binding protein